MRGMRKNFRLLNVFAIAGARFSGNPLCVFEDGSGLDDAQMQALALQFNLSETTFILPSAQASAAVRIFTPAMELPFAGHPTLGTAQVVRDLKGTGERLTLAMQAGVIPVSANENAWTLQANAPVVRAFDAGRIPDLACALGLCAADFADPPRWIDTGMEQLLVPLVSKEAVRRATPNPGLTQFTNPSGKMSAYVFSPLADEEMLVRFYFTKNAGQVAEDPATGSACANLGGYALASGHAPPLVRVLHQGKFTGRPSRLRLEVDANKRIFVGGDVVELGRGYVDL